MDSWLSCQLWVDEISIPVGEDKPTGQKIITSVVLSIFLDIFTTVLYEGNEEIMTHTPHQTLINLVIKSRRIIGWGL
jgi:hypothetical protein